jgi:uncharacterized protein YfaS (alpha-2-macroglobulin family)
MWMGLVNLKVSAEKKNLRVQVETERTDYRPGDLVKGRIVVTADGAPVESEVSLSAADEGVLQLINFATPDPMNTFYAPFGLGVDTAASWLRIARPLAPDDLNGEDGADGGGAPGERIRSRFVASAYWAPALVTDRNGEVVFQFKAPDNLTAFRLMAVAADRADRFGAGDRRIRIAKKMQALPVLPRFFSAGDTAKVGAVVHNYSGKKGTADVVLKMKGARTATDRQSVSVPAGDSAVATFLVTAEDAEQAEFTVEVRMNGHFDAFALTLPVRRNLVTDRRLLGDGRLDAPVVIDIDWPAGIRENDSDLQLTIDRFGMGALAAGLQYLIGYPYGCLEQTMSKLVPMFKVKDLAASMKLDALKDTDLDTFISLGVAKVLRHQHDDGHFSLWIGSEPEPFLTAYALWGLLEAQSAGIRVNRRAMENGRRALAAFAGETRDLSNRGEAAELAIAAWVLARLETPDAGLTARLFESRASLPLYGRAFLLRAFLSAGLRGDETTTLVNELVAAAQTTGNSAFIEEEDGLSWYMSSSARTTAIAISALLEYDRAHPLIEPLVEGLKARRSGAGRWENTQENAYALIAIADFVRGQAEGSPEVTVTIGDRVLLQQSVQGGAVIALSQPLSAVGKGRLSITGTGPVFYNATLSLARDAAFHEAVDQGLKVEREYLDGDTLAPIRAVAIGDIVRVRLLVTSRRAVDYLALEDPFPAGFEAVNTNLSTEDSSLAGGTAMSGEWTWRELRDDRVQAFADRMSEGQQVLEYLLRATTEGTFAAAPAHAELMYEPSTTGRTDAVSIPVSR